jgi:hypothetical protein
MLPPRTKALPLSARTRLLLLRRLMVAQARPRPSLRAKVQVLQRRQQPPRQPARPLQGAVRALPAARRLPQVRPPPLLRGEEAPPPLPPPRRLRLLLQLLLLRVGLAG